MTGVGVRSRVPWNGSVEPWLSACGSPVASWPERRRPWSCRALLCGPHLRGAPRPPLLLTCPPYRGGQRRPLRRGRRGLASTPRCAGFPRRECASCGKSQRGVLQRMSPAQSSWPTAAPAKSARSTGWEPWPPAARNRRRRPLGRHGQYVLEQSGECGYRQPARSGVRGGDGHRTSRLRRGWATDAQGVTVNDGSSGGRFQPSRTPTAGWPPGEPDSAGRLAKRYDIPS